MISASGNTCGATPFEKRAVNWAAARYAGKAGRVDPSLKRRAAQFVARYKGLAPQQKEIFMSKKYQSGSTITFNCWIGESVRIP